MATMPAALNNSMTEWLAGLMALVIIIVLYARFIEPYWLAIREYRLGAGGIRILHLSDLHLKTGDRRLLRLLDRAVTRGIALRPDLICCTGDFITAGRPFPSDVLTSLLARLAAAAPTCASLGNHDGGDWAKHDVGPVKAALQGTGVRLLQNQSVSFEVRGRRARVVGLGDLWANGFDPIPAFSKLDSDEDVVVLSHNPDTFTLLHRFPGRLQLSGHTHGGQVALFGWAPWTPVRDRSLRRGLKQRDGRLIYVTTGLGNLGGIRFGCRPEIALLSI